MNGSNKATPPGYGRSARPNAEGMAELSHVESRRAAKYAVVGVANVTIDFVLYALFVSFGLWYVAAKALSLLVATLNGYTFNRMWTFRAGPQRHEMMVKYFSVQAFCLVSNIALLTVLVEIVDLGAILAQVVAIPAIAGLSFLGNRLWTFQAHLDPER